MSEPFIPSAEQIQIIQNHEKGWEDIWKKIWIELYSLNGKGRLYQIIRRVVNPQDYGDFVSYICEHYWKLITKQQLFLTYNHNKCKEDVYLFLCGFKTMPFLFGKQTISQVYTLYKRE
ncbi:MAG: hypothetical protein LBJ67_15830, partial [Planctomycetaceae bacterium]|nr:hypothetical protein [Planctomycetaceae bacterium]